MSALLEAGEPSADASEKVQSALVKRFEVMATASEGVARLRRVILQLAVRGKLLKQETSDENATTLVRRIHERNGQCVGRASAPLITFNSPYELPSTWTWAELGVLVENMGSGWSPACDEAERTDNTRWAVLRTTAVQQMHYRPCEHKVLPLKLSPRPDIEVKVGDILITRAGPMNRVGVSCYVSSTPARLMLSDKIVRFRSVGDEMLPAFLVLALNAGWTQEQLEAAKTGMAASQVNVSQGDLKKLPIPVCSKREQARIVARVDELMRVCDALEEKGRLEVDQHEQLLNILLDTLISCASSEELALNWQRVAANFDLLLDRPESVDAFEQTVLELAVRGLLARGVEQGESAARMLSRIERARRTRRKLVHVDKESLASASYSLPAGWAWASVDQLSADAENAICDGPFGANLKTEHYVESPGFRVIRLQNIGRGSFRNEHRAFIDEQRFLGLRKHEAFTGDIVIAGLVDDAIRCCIVPPGVGPAIVKADCYRFAVHEEIVSEYVCLYLTSRVAHEFASAHHHGLTLTRIGLGNFRSIPVPVPPLQEQRRIVAVVEQLRRFCFDLRQKLGAARAVHARIAESLVQSPID